MAISLRLIRVFVFLLIFASAAFAQLAEKASITSPSPGSILSGSTVTFSWTEASGASEYRLEIGTTLGASDIFGTSVRGSTSCTVNSLPTDGSTVYVRLSTEVGGAWQSNDYAFTTGAGGTTDSGNSVSKATVLSPTPGSTLTVPIVIFSWSAGSGAQAYKLEVGATQGGSDIFQKNEALVTSETVKSIPLDCRPVYVRLSTMLAGTWQYNDYTYNGCAQPQVQATGSSGSSPSVCSCADAGSVRHRLEETVALKTALEAKLQVTSPSEPATREAWLALQNEVRGTLPQLSYTFPATEANVAMFNNYVDPLCGSQGTSGGACLDASVSAHQGVHEPSCRAGRWNGQSPWTMQASIQEEINANQTEMNYLQSQAQQLACACASSFGIVVQVVTTSGIAVAGMTENSARSLNNGQGILIPITVHPDGTFEGSGSGTDSGSAAAYAAGGSAASQFGHAVNVQATGAIHPGNCSSQPCTPDMMHLVVSGFGAPQSTDMQARFPAYSANMHQVTQSGAAAVEFDLPAYSGQSAQKTLFNMGPINSTMSVGIVSGDAAAGASVLRAAQRCSGANGGVQQFAGGGSVGGTIAAGGVGGVVGGASGGTGQNQSGNSNPAQSTPQSIPAAPDWINILMTPSATLAGNVQVTWSAVDGAQTYNVYRKLRYIDSAASEMMVGTVTAGTTSFTDTTVPLFIAADYSVTAVNALGEGPRRSAPETRAVATPDAPVWGFADTHTHPFVDRAFGGMLFWGRAFGPMSTALGDCGKVHKTQNVDAGALVAGVLLGGLIGPAAAAIPVAGPVLALGLGPLLGPTLGTAATDAMQIVHPGTKGAPTFDSWPRFDTKVHQMMFESWLYRAYVGGLRLMVAHAVNNETMCDGLKGIGQIAQGRTCDDMEAVALQLQDARDMESYINSECASGDFGLGCVAPGVGWFHVVTSSSEARQTINKGQLAVVLGIEVDHPFGCGMGKTCFKSDVEHALQDVYSAGVRHMHPIHLTDNPFGGMALYGDMFAASSQFLNGTPVQATECPVDAMDGSYTFRLSGYPQTAACNTQGLTDLGKFLVQDLANKHMIIDVDHMSRKAVEDTFSLVTPFNYPVISGHNTLVSLHLGAGRTEAARTTEQVTTIKGLGGVVSIGLGDVGTTKDVATAPESPLVHTCSNSSNTWFQSYSRAVALQGGWSTAAVALSTDQGLTDMIGPRFKGNIGEACAGGDASEAAAQSRGAWVVYPFSTLTPGTRLPLKQSSAGRSFDFNTEGLAHFGLFPDFVQDLLSQGATVDEMGPLFRSAEAYLQMWTRAEQVAVPMPAEHAATPVQGVIALQIDSGSGQTTSWAKVNASDSLTGTVLSGTVLIDGGNGVVTGTTGSKITFPNCYQVTGTGANKQKSVTACNGKVTVQGYSQVTFSVPALP